MSTRETSQDDVEVVRVARAIEVDAPVEQVWESVARLDRLAGWLGVPVGPHVARDGAAGPGEATDLDPDLDLDPVAGGEVELAVGAAVRVVEGDGAVRHLLVTDVDGPHRVAWHWWREDGELSAVEITLDPASAEGEERPATTVVRVVETLALASASAGGRAALDVAIRLDDEWGTVLSGLATRLGRKLGAVAPR